MNDFLTRLAQRSIGAAPLIAPRLPSLFAPVEESQSSNFPQASNFENTTTVTEAVQNSTLASPPIHPPKTERAEPIPVESRDSPQRSTLPEAASAPAPAPRIASTPPRVEPTLVQFVETTQANFQATAPLLTPVVPHPAAPLEPPPAPRKQDTPAAAPDPWLPLLPQRKAEPPAAFPAMTDTPASADTGTPPAPTVHITIGRVEVRANVAAPPAAPRPRAASQPALSLGDYLKRGAGAS